MKACWVIAFAFAALTCGLHADYLWRRSTKVRAEPGGFEPVIPELQRGWWQLAEWKAAEQSSRFNARAAWWTAAAGILGFASVVVGVWH